MESNNSVGKQEIDNPMNIATDLWERTNPMVTACMEKKSYLIGACEGIKYSRNHEQPLSPQSSVGVKEKQNILDNIPLDEEGHREFFTKKEVFRAMTEYSSLQNSELRKEVEELKAWKESAINVWPPMQEIAKVIGVGLGESIHDKILPAIKDLQQSNEEKDKECGSLNEILSQKMELLRKANERIEELEKQVNSL